MASRVRNTAREIVGLARAVGLPPKNYHSSFFYGNNQKQQPQQFVHGLSIIFVAEKLLEALLNQVLRVVLQPVPVCSVYIVTRTLATIVIQGDVVGMKSFAKKSFSPELLTLIQSPYCKCNVIVVMVKN